MVEERYSHDQKERAFNKTREYFSSKKGIVFDYQSYKDFEDINRVTSSEVHNYYHYALRYMNTPFPPKLSGKQIIHPLDIEYFNDYPAPIMELVHSAHFTNINSTISFFGPMLYYFARAIGAEQILEVGVAEGYTSWYLAHAVKDNAIRYGMQGNMYYGVDILDRTQVVKPKLDAAGLPNTLIQMDSIHLTPETFKDIRFDIIFLDGCHDREHIVHEVNVLYPQLKGQGNGFLILHDVYGPGEVGCHEVIKDPKYEWEFVRICEIYGIAILRKMQGYKEGPRWRD